MARASSRRWMHQASWGAPAIPDAFAATRKQTSVILKCRQQIGGIYGWKVKPLRTEFRKTVPIGPVKDRTLFEFPICLYLDEGKKCKFFGAVDELWIDNKSG